MTIKRKLFLVVLGELLMFLAAAAVTLLFFLPILSINKETAQLKELGEQVQTMRVEINRLFSNPIEVQQAKLRHEKMKLGAMFDVIENQKMLKRINTKVERSMDSILLLEKLYDERWETADLLVGEVVKDAKEKFFSGTIPLVQFYRTDMLKRYDDYEDVMTRVGKLVTIMDITDGALNSAYDVITTQFGLIENEVSKKYRSLLIRAILIFTLITAGIIFIALFVAGRMVKSIIKLEKGVSELRDGRLSVDFDSDANDEIGKLGANLNDFTCELSTSIRKIKLSSGNNIKMKDELLSAAADSTSSTSKISDSIVEIRDGIVDLDDRVSASGKEVNTVKTNTDELKVMLEEQMAMIEESTSAVTEMIASISNVGDITRRKKAATGELVSTAGIGGERLNETIRIIQEITSSVDDIRGTASAIQSVAAQTSLLAMNAAIEAAHAGKYGAGFAVVAEEIRKLSEASGESSRQISGVLKEVVQSIEKAALSGAETKTAFMNINSEVSGVADALDEITGSMEELAAGGHQILEAMTALRGYGARVNESGDAMSDSSESLKDAFRAVESVTTNVLSRVAGITRGVDEIVAAVKIVSSISGRLSSESEELNAGVARFSIEEDASEPDSPDEWVEA